MRSARSVVATIVALCVLTALPASAGQDLSRQIGPQEDAENMTYAMGRIRDQYSNPAFAAYFWTQTLETYSAGASDQLQHPDRPMISLGQWVPGGSTTDPYRHNWEPRGIRVPIEYENRYGARITGNIWAPRSPFRDPVTGKRATGPYPSVVITTGSIQGYEEMYWWAAQGLAEAGYVVMTYDVQGQGQSETFGHNPDGSLWCGSDDCPGVPFQQAANFYEGTEDALSFFLSDDNPLRGLVDESRLGLAGHSLGASAVTDIGNSDERIDAVVAWDNASLSEDIEPRVPTMGQNAEYFFNPTPNPTPPDPDGKNGTYRRFEEAGVPAMQIALRGSTHLEWTYVPYILPASSEGERVGMYYTLAWFDRWLKGDEPGNDGKTQSEDAVRRLTATEFDDSADVSAIGAGGYDPATNSNVPHTIEGDPVAEHLSIYYRSSYAIGHADCADMKAGC